MSQPNPRPTASHQDGFTLLELLVVMVIVGILVAIAVPTLLSQRDKARETASKQAVEAIATEIDSALVDGSVGALSPTIIDNSAGPGIAEAAFSYGAHTSMLRVSAGQVVTYQIEATGEYCVQADHASPGARPWRVRQGTTVASGLSQGTCP